MKFKYSAIEFSRLFFVHLNNFGHRYIKTVLISHILAGAQAQGFSTSDRFQPDPQNQIVLGFLGQNPMSPLQFPCLLQNGEVSCDSDLIRMNSSVCQRTLFFKKNINNQYEVSCQLSLSKTQKLGISYPGQRPVDGYLRLQMNPQVKLENVLKPRKSGFGYFVIHN